mgnify:CR=1 FL=1
MLVSCRCPHRAGPSPDRRTRSPSGKLLFVSVLLLVLALVCCTAVSVVLPRCTAPSSIPCTAPSSIGAQPQAQFTPSHHLVTFCLWVCCCWCWRWCAALLLVRCCCRTQPQAQFSNTPTHLVTIWQAVPKEVQCVNPLHVLGTCTSQAEHSKHGQRRYYAARWLLQWDAAARSHSC